jgi:OOP family OmpA-OmpF porin
MRTSLVAVSLFAACAGQPVVRHEPAPPRVTPSAAVERPAPAAAFQVEAGALVLPGPLLFTEGEAVPTAESDTALQHVVAFLTAKPDVTLLRIEVHTDGATAEDQAVSEARALAIAVRLQELGADEARLLPVGFGGTKPVSAPDTPAGRAQNRRIEFRPAELRGKPIGGMPVDGGGRVVRARQ